MPVQETSVDDSIYNVHWALPSLSIVLQAVDHAPVQALITPENRGWQPFNPEACAEMPKLDDYGVTYPFCSSPSSL